jgi:hypothetical protein
VLLEHGKFMPGLVEALLGCGIGDTRVVDLTFPQRTAGPGAALAGTDRAVVAILRSFTFSAEWVMVGYDGACVTIPISYLRS